MQDVPSPGRANRLVFHSSSNRHAASRGVYHAAFAAVLLAANQSGRKLTGHIGHVDLLFPGVATHKPSRITATDFVTRPLRAARLGGSVFAAVARSDLLR